MNVINDLGRDAGGESRREVSADRQIDHDSVTVERSGGHLWQTLTSGESGWPRRAAILLCAAIIVAATLPWEFTNHAHWRRIVWVPFTGIVRPLDLVGNALLYVPLGIALQWRTPCDARLSGILAAAVLSVSMETAQIWSHYRFPSATDVLMNVIGVLAGAHWLWRREISHAVGTRALEG